MSRSGLREEKQPESVNLLNNSSRTDLYVYKSLDEESASIRLVQLTRDQISNRIICNLVSQPFDKTPSYDAVSYTWGNTALTHGILVDGKWLPTSVAVWDIIQQQAPQETTKSVYIWIDFICINQKDFDEKSWQVDMMRKIYKRAEQVVVCLGNSPNDDAKLVIQQVEHLRSQLSNNDEHVEDFQRQVNSPELGDSSPNWDAFVSLVNHKFWTRVWIVQEVSLARKLRIVYGGQELPWEGFVTVIDAFQSISNEGPLGIPKMAVGLPKTGMPFLGVAHILLVVRIRQKVQDDEMITFRDMLIDSSKFEATDPRDHIFGLQGLVTVPINPALRADYKKTVTDIFKATARHFLQKEDGNWVLELAGLGFQRRVEDLPSWTPDFSCNQRIPGGPKETNPLVSILKSFGITQKFTTIQQPVKSRPLEMFFLQGIIATRIENISALSADVNPDAGPANLMLSAFKVFGALLEMHSMATTAFSTRYHVTDEECSEAFWRTLIQTTGTDELADMLRVCYSALEKMPALYKTVFGRMFSSPGESVQASMPGVEDTIVQTSFLTTRFMMAFGMRSGGLKFALLSGGYMAMVPPRAKRGDVVIVVKDQSFLFRESDISSGQRMFRLVGKCYVHGLTASRLMDAGKVEEGIAVY